MMETRWMLRAMQFLAVTLILAGASCLFAACESDDAAGPAGSGEPTSMAKGDVATTDQTQANGERFALSLYQRLAPSEGNALCCPLGAEEVLRMLLAGADGRTAEQLARAVGMEPGGEVASVVKPLLASKGASDVLQAANGLWTASDVTLTPAFTRRITETFDAANKPFDPQQPGAAAKMINTWIAEKTSQKVTELLQPQTLDGASLVLTNATCFDGRWAEAFDPGKTQAGEFHVEPDKTVTVMFMARRATCPYFEDDLLQAVELDYAGGAFSMLLMLPQSEKRPADITKRLTTDGLSGLCTTMKPRRVALQLPRFSIAASLDLKPPLQDMGVTDAFDSEADFSPMTAAEELYVDSVQQGVRIIVSEKGTEATAGTAAVMKPKSMEFAEEPVVFRADRPFLFALRHKASGRIAFIGRLAAPRPATP